jgi:hypothetical protein
MRSKTEYRRCGCGNLIGLRESCARCADKRRAELHASGVGHRECWREFRGDGSVVVRPAAGVDVVGVPAGGIRLDYQPRPRRLEQLASEAAEQAHRLTGRVPYAVVTPQPEGDTVYWVMDGKAHQCHWVGGAERSVVMDGRVSVESGTQPGVLGFVRPLPRPPSERFCGPPTPGQVAEHDQLWRRVRARIEELTTKHEPPAVGAEVDYATALHDMQSRPEARYITSYGMCIYAWHSVLCYAFEGRMEENCFSLDELSELTWTRVPDGWSAPLSLSQEVLLRDLRSSAKLTRALPALGAEVSWAEAERDMRARPEARYSRVSGSSRDVYRCRDDKLEFYYGYASAWTGSGLEAKTLAAGIWRGLADATDNEQPRPCWR